jgi:hypothetical protein
MDGLALPSSFRSYGITTVMNGEIGFGYIENVNRDRATKYNQIVLPSNKFVFADHFDERSFSRGSWVFKYFVPEFFDGIAIWHTKKQGYSYADGHTKFYRWQDPRTYKFAYSQVHRLLPGDPQYIDEATASANNEDVKFIATAYRARSN